MKIFLHLMSLELRRTLSYRVDFWVEIVVAVSAQVLIAYFLWKAIFLAANVPSIGGYSLSNLVSYFLVSSLLLQTVQLSTSAVSQDIYDGSISRFLVLPSSFFMFKLAAHSVRVIQGILQLGIVFVGAHALGVIPTLPSPAAIGLGLFLTFAAAYLFFLLAFSSQLLGFWTEEAWAPEVILKFLLTFFGGAVVPISLFPAWSQNIILCLPFSAIISLPARVFLGEAGTAEICGGIATLLVWVGIGHLIAARVWRAGVRSFSGVGL